MLLMQMLLLCWHHLTPLLSRHTQCFKCPCGGVGLWLLVIVAALWLAFKAAVVGDVLVVACMVDEPVVDKVAVMATVSEVGIKGGWGFTTLSLLGVGVTVVVVAEDTRSLPLLLLTVLILSNVMVRRRAGSKGKRVDRTSTMGTTMELLEGQVPVSPHLIQTHSWYVL